MAMIIKMPIELMTHIWVKKEYKKLSHPNLLSPPSLAAFVNPLTVVDQPGVTRRRHAFI